MLCDTRPQDQPAKTNHFPIDTNINLKLRQAPMQDRRDFRNIDWKTFTEKLGDRLENKTLPEPIPSSQELSRNVKAITLAISETIDEVVPITKLTPFTKRWWNKDIAKLRQVMRSRVRLAYRHKDDRMHEAHEQHRRAHNEYADAIVKAKKDTWTKYLELLDNRTLWSASRPTTDGGGARIPDLTYKDKQGHSKQAVTNKDKAKTFYDTFFTKELDSEAATTQVTF